MPALLVLIFCVIGYSAFCPDDDRGPVLLKLLAVVVVSAFVVRAVVGWIAEQIRLGRHSERLGRLDAFAGRLTRGTTDGRGFYSGGLTTVAGKLDGRDVELLVRMGPRPTIAFELRVPDALAVDAHAPPLPLWFLGSGPVIALARGASRGELESALRTLVADRGLSRVIAGGGRLRGEKAFRDEDLALEWLVDTARGLGRIARLAELEASKSSVEGKVQLASSEGGERRCPFCHGALDPQARDVSECPECHTGHHRECLVEAGGCTVFGCPGAGRALARRGRAAAKTAPRTSQESHTFLGERSRARP